MFTSHLLLTPTRYAVSVSDPDSPTFYQVFVTPLSSPFDLSPSRNFAIFPTYVGLSRYRLTGKILLKAFLRAAPLTLLPSPRASLLPLKSIFSSFS